MAAAAGCGGHAPQWQASLGSSASAFEFDGAMSQWEAQLRRGDDMLRLLVEEQRKCARELVEVRRRLGILEEHKRLSQDAVVAARLDSLEAQLAESSVALWRLSSASLRGPTVFAASTLRGTAGLGSAAQAEAQREASCEALKAAWRPAALTCLPPSPKGAGEELRGGPSALMAAAHGSTTRRAASGSAVPSLDQLQETLGAEVSVLMADLEARLRVELSASTQLLVADLRGEVQRELGQRSSCDKVRPTTDWLPRDAEGDAASTESVLAQLGVFENGAWDASPEELLARPTGRFVYKVMQAVQQLTGFPGDNMEEWPLLPDAKLALLQGTWQSIAAVLDIPPADFDAADVMRCKNRHRTRRFLQLLAIAAAKERASQAARGLPRILPKVASKSALVDDKVPTHTQSFQKLPAVEFERAWHKETAPQRQALASPSAAQGRPPPAGSANRSRSAAG